MENICYFYSRLSNRLYKKSIGKVFFGAGSQTTNVNKTLVYSIAQLSCDGIKGMSHRLPEFYSNFSYDAKNLQSNTRTALAMILLTLTSKSTWRATGPSRFLTWHQATSCIFPTRQPVMLTSISARLCGPVDMRTQIDCMNVYRISYIVYRISYIVYPLHLLWLCHWAIL